MLNRRHHPLGTPPRLHLQHIHLIDLLQRPPLALNHREEDHDARDGIAGREDVPVAEIDVPDDERREEGQHEVPEPVRGGGERHGFRAVARGVELAGDGPDHGAPGGGEAEDEEGGEDDHGFAGGRGAAGVGAVEGEVPDGGEDQEADEHPGGARHEGLAAAVVLDDVEPIEGGAEVDAVEDHLRHEGIVDADGGEDRGAVVEEVISAR